MTSSEYQDLLKTRKKIEELGMFCVKFGITKCDLQAIASKKLYEKEKRRI